MNMTIEGIYEHVLTTAQLFERGLTKTTVAREVGRGELLRLRSGIYIETSFWNGLPAWDKELVRIIALHKKNPDVVFSHVSAARLLGLAVVGQHDIHIYASTRNRCTLPGISKHCLLTPEVPTLSNDLGIKITPVLHTLLDCARFLPLKEAVVLLDSALKLGYVGKDKLQQNLAKSTGRNCRKMRRLATMVSDKSESAGESYTRLLLDEMGLSYVEQQEFVLEGRRYRCDFVLKDLGLIVEFDGRLKLTDFGASDAVLEQERYREKALQNAGWVVFRADWDLVVRRPEDFKRQIHRFIRRDPGFAPKS